MFHAPHPTSNNRLSRSPHQYPPSIQPPPRLSLFSVPQPGTHLLDPLQDTRSARYSIPCPSDFRVCFRTQPFKPEKEAEQLTAEARPHSNYSRKTPPLPVVLLALVLTISSLIRLLHNGPPSPLPSFLPRRSSFTMSSLSAVFTPSPPSTQEQNITATRKKGKRVGH